MSGSSSPASCPRRFFEETVESTPVYTGKLLHVSKDRVRLPDGFETEREHVRHPGAIVIIAVRDDAKLVFERQFRYPHRREFLELPAGKIEAGEDILHTAKRELQEETGYHAGDWRHLGVVHPCIGYSNERIEVFLARQLTQVEAAPDVGELLEVLALPLAEAVEAIRRGEITDGKTIAALFWAEKILNGVWTLPD